MKNPATEEKGLLQCHLPGLWKKVAVQEGIVVRKKYAHARMCVKPAYDPLALKAPVYLIVYVKQRIFRKGKINIPLLGMTGRKYVFYDHELFTAILIQTPLPYHDSTDFHLGAARVYTDANVRRAA